MRARVIAPSRRGGLIVRSSGHPTVGTGFGPPKNGNAYHDLGWPNRYVKRDGVVGHPTARGVVDVTESGARYDVAVVGGGPAGSSAAVFTARAGLDTVVFDRGTSSLARCAYLENYLGFPAGIDVATFSELMHDQVAAAGGEVVADLVERVERAAEGAFVLDTQDGRTVAADAVVATTKYDASYLRPLDDRGGMFVTHDHGGEEHEHFDREYPDDDGRTPVEGLYVAGPLAGATDQAIVAAGHGASVACELLRDRRADAGFWDSVATHWDWLRRAGEVDDEDALREHLREWAAGEAPDGLGPGDDRFERVCDRLLEDRLAAYVDAETVDERAEAGMRALAEHLPDDLLLDAVDDDRVREYAASLPADAGE